MSTYSRRGFLIGAGGGAALMTSACANGVGSNGGGAAIDARVDATLNYLYNRYPGTQDLAAKSVGMLVMPLVTEAGFGIGGGAYGRGALRVNDITVDYYLQAEASFGLQIGAQQYAHVLFFMTNEALQASAPRPAGRLVVTSNTRSRTRGGTGCRPIRSPRCRRWWRWSLVRRA